MSFYLLCKEYVCCFLAVCVDNDNDDDDDDDVDDDDDSDYYSENIYS
jgi:hypothetical protein